MSPKNKPREAKRIRKRKQNEANESGEKPNKKTNSVQNTTQSVVYVNKSDPVLSNTQLVLVDMAGFNTPVYDASFTQLQQNRPQFHQLPIAPPTFHQSPTSPGVGFYTSTPQNMQPVPQAINQMIDPSSMNYKLENLSQKMNEICEKLSSVDILTEKLTSFDKTVQNLTKTVEK